MSTIKISCVDQVMQFTSTPVIASGGVKEDFVEFTFCSLWDGYEKTAIFVKNTDVALDWIDGNGRCAIPFDITKDAGRFYIGIFGVNAEGIRRTSEYLEYKLVEGAVTSVEPPEEPSIYEKVLAAAAGKQEPLVWDDKPTEGSKNAVNSGGIYQAMQGYVPTSRKVNNKALGEDIQLTAEDVGAVPPTRTVNGKALDRNITLSAANVNAVPTTRTINSKELTEDIYLTAMDVEAVPTTRTVNGKALGKDIELTAEDVEAVPTTRTVNGKALDKDIQLTAEDIVGVFTGTVSFGTEEPTGGKHGDIYFKYKA